MMKRLKLIAGICVASSIFSAFPAMPSDDIPSLFLSRVEAAAESMPLASVQAEGTPWRFIPTTEQSVIFSFGGLSKRAPLERILKTMQANNMHGTFFVTPRELKRNANNIALIRSYGHDLAIGISAIENGTADMYVEQIKSTQAALQSRYGVKTNITRQMVGATESAVEEAVKRTGCILVGQSVNVVQSRHKEAQTPDEVMSNIFGRWTTSLNRGAIVYMRTDFYTNDNLASELLVALKERKIDNIGYSTFDDRAKNNTSGYKIVSVQDVLNNKHLYYDYPVPKERVPEELQVDYRDVVITDKNFKKEFYKRYIGAPEVNQNDRMLDFDRGEMRHVDKTGLVKTADPNTIFLTFDDWGMDDSINRLLYVLRKHEAKGTFFVITWNMVNNPNLLRAIAAEGNEIGSHTNLHKPMAMADENGKMAAVLTDEEYDEDVRIAYQKLVDAAGDMKFPNGRPALTRLLRPPTLAVSKNGSRSILDAGYTYIVNGSGSTEDYGAVSMQSLVGIMNNLTHDEKGNVKTGAILIMHMTSTAERTARAVDIFLTHNDSLPDGHPGKFKVGLLGDYLVGDYDQMAKMKPKTEEQEN